MKSLITLLFFILFISTALAQLTNRLDRLEVNDLKSKKLEVISTTSGSIPCPKMTQTERNNIASPIEGQCIYNSTVQTLNLYDGSAWVEVAGGGGEGGIANWEASKFYQVGDVVIYSDEIYQCIEEHTSGVSFDPTKFQILAQNLANSYGVLSMSKGGTEKALTPQLGGIVYTDAGSMEVLAAGDLGKFLQSNGAAAPSWESISIDDSSFSGVLSLEKGGTNKNLTASDGAIAYSDADSLELLAPGSAGQILQSNGFGAPSFVNKSISAKAGNNSSVTVEEFQVANNQLTETDTNKHLIETGNKNILTNPSFEHSTVSTGWTLTSGALASESIIKLAGSKSLKAILSSQALELYQDSPLYASQFNGSVQGLGYIRIKTQVTGLKVCARKAAVTQTSLCVDVQANNEWGFYKIPFVLGGTSNGLVVTSNGAFVTGDIYVDDAFLGAVDLKADVGGCDSIECETVFSAQVSATASHGSENLDFIDSCSTSGTGIFTCTYKTGIFTVAPNLTISINDGSGVCREVRSYDATATGFSYNTFDSASVVQNCAVSVKVQKQGADFTAAQAKSGGSIYTSKNADTDWQTYTPTTSWTGSNTATGKWKRKGSMMEVQARISITGSSNASSTTISLPSGYTIDTNKLTSSTQFATKIGDGTYHDASGGTTRFDARVYYDTTSQVRVRYLTSNFSSVIYSNVDITNTAPATAVAGNYIEVKFEVPIQGWENSNIIIGQFNGLESCSDSYECTDTFSAKVSSAGVVSDENIDWIDGNCSYSSGNYSCSFKSGIFTVPPNCAISLEAGTLNQLSSTTSSGFSGIAYDSSAPFIATNRSFHVICQKQGADYIGKTAKAVASDQNLRTPGITNGVEYRARISFDGTILKQEGSWLSSVTNNSTGDATININPGVFQSYPYCICVPETSEADSGFYICNQVLNTLSNTQVKFRGRNNTNTAFNIQAIISCKEVAP